MSCLDRADPELVTVRVPYNLVIAHRTLWEWKRLFLHVSQLDKHYSSLSAWAWQQHLSSQPQKVNVCLFRPSQTSWFYLWHFYQGHIWTTTMQSSESIIPLWWLSPTVDTKPFNPCCSEHVEMMCSLPGSFSYAIHFQQKERISHFTILNIEWNWVWRLLFPYAK